MLLWLAILLPLNLCRFQKYLCPIYDDYKIQTIYYEFQTVTLNYHYSERQSTYGSTGDAMKC